MVVWLYHEREEKIGMEKLKFDRKCKCDFCGHVEICAVNHYGTSLYNRLVCVECAMSINQKNTSSIHFGFCTVIISVPHGARHDLPSER